jgi:hypothetical protein
VWTRVITRLKSPQRIYQLTGARIPKQMKRLRVLASSRFALGGWDRPLKAFLELAGKNLESIMVEKWMEKSGVKKVTGNLTIKFRAPVAP